MGEHGELLTVAEAAARVGLSERTLSRILQSDSFAARTVTEYGPAGPATRVPPPLMAELRAFYETGRALSADEPGGGAGEPPGWAEGGPAAPAPLGPEAASLAAQIASARETILRADQARDLAEQARARAEAALERALAERDAEAQRLHTSLGRAQDALTQALTALTHEQHRTRQLMTVQAELVHALPPPDPPLLDAPAPPDAAALPDAATRPPAPGDEGEPTLDRETPAAIEAQIEAARPPAGDRPGFWGRLWRGITD